MFMAHWIYIIFEFTFGKQRKSLTTRRSGTDGLAKWVGQATRGLNAGGGGRMATEFSAGVSKLLESAGSLLSCGAVLGASAACFFVTTGGLVDYLNAGGYLTPWFGHRGTTEGFVGWVAGWDSHASVAYMWTNVFAFLAFLAIQLPATLLFEGGPLFWAEFSGRAECVHVQTCGVSLIAALVLMCLMVNAKAALLLVDMSSHED